MEIDKIVFWKCVDYDHLDRMTFDFFPFRDAILIFVNVCHTEHREEGSNVRFKVVYYLKWSGDFSTKGYRKVEAHLNGAFHGIKPVIWREKGWCNQLRGIRITEYQLRSTKLFYYWFLVVRIRSCSWWDWVIETLWIPQLMVKKFNDFSGSVSNIYN